MVAEVGVLLLREIVAVLVRVVALTQQQAVLVILHQLHRHKVVTAVLVRLAMQLFDMAEVEVGVVLLVKQVLIVNQVLAAMVRHHLFLGRP